MSGTKILFKESNWEIHDNPLQHFRLSPAASRVVHWCPVPRIESFTEREEYCHVWGVVRENLNCPICAELMPDSIQTLWTLQNFDIDFSQEYGYTEQPHRVGK
jgi:hypothetical protein